MIQNEGEHKWEFDTFPNIAELFDLFPYVMYFNRTIDIDGQKYNEFKYSYPLGKSHNPNESEFLMYFTEDTMDLNKITMKAHSLNITNPLSLYASQPITAAKFDSDSMSFKNVKCNKVKPEE